MTLKVPFAKIDFKEWMTLAKQDPVLFEQRRAELIEAVILCSPLHQQQRLRQLQWKIDGIRLRSGSPLGACIKISNLMLEKVCEQQTLLLELQAEIRVKDCGKRPAE
jgi:hypothetical protein